MLTLYKARSIITMNNSLPRATAVLVRDGMIIEVGEPERMGPWLRHEDHVVDDRFAEKIICPGFIDPHLHPSMAAVLLPMEFVTAMRWKLPWGEVEPVTDPQGLTSEWLRLVQKARQTSRSLFGVITNFGMGR